MDRVLIVGGNGAGKSVFAKALAEKSGLPLVHLDALYWKEGWQPAAPEEFDKLLARELKKPRWILDGNIRRTLPLRLQYCDTVFFFDFSRWACLRGVVRRSLTHLGRDREDLPANCPDGLHFAFWRSVWAGHRQGQEVLRKMLTEAKAPVVVFRNRKDADEFLRKFER